MRGEIKVHVRIRKFMWWAVWSGVVIAKIGTKARFNFLYKIGERIVAKCLVVNLAEAAR